MTKHDWLYKYTMDLPMTSTPWKSLLLLLNDRKDIKNKLDVISEFTSKEINKLLDRKLNNSHSKFFLLPKPTKIKIVVDNNATIRVYISDKDICGVFNACTEQHALYLSLVYAIRKIYCIKEPFIYNKCSALGTVECYLHDEFNALLKKI